MGIFDLLKDESKDSITLKVIAGQKYFDGAVGFSGAITFKQHEKGPLFVTGKNGLQGYLIKSYEWDGPTYKSVTTTKETTTAKGGGRNVSHSKGKTKRTGRLTGAVVGTLIMPGVGTVIGAMYGTGNKKTKGKITERDARKDKLKHWGTSSTEDVEVSGTAYMTLQNIKTKETFTFSFKCNSKIHVDIQNMLLKANLA